MMEFIAGSTEWLRQNAYTVKRTGPREYTVIDDEDSDSVVCKADTHANAVRKLIELRFTD